MDAAVTKNPAKSPIQIDIKIAPPVKLFAMLNDQSIITRTLANTTNPMIIANEFLFSPMIYITHIPNSDIFVQIHDTNVSF